MINRVIEKELILTSKEYPVITITGPRQAGKTTLARKVFPGYSYINLEHPETRVLAQEDPKSLFQRVPELLSWVQVISDENQEKMAHFILTSSRQPALREAISQSLAGRTALLHLLPLSLEELSDTDKQKSQSELILKGFMPRLYDKPVRPQRYYRDYYATYVERDVRQLMAIQDQQAFELFLRLLAGRVGQVANLSQIANQVGISAPQIKKWISVLEASFIIFKLPPYYRNLGKRLTKTPKLYFTEPGLAAYLLGIETAGQLERDPAFGGLFENMVVVDILKSRYNRGKEGRLSFFRDHHGNEVDLLLPFPGSGSGPLPVEIKSSRTYRSDFLNGLAYFRKLLPDAPAGCLIYDGDLEFKGEEGQVINFRKITGSSFREHEEPGGSGIAAPAPGRTARGARRGGGRSGYGTRGRS
jgi:predicted AAA+ superfamily ATPase